jgi:hypothetical protein
MSTFIATALLALASMTAASTPVQWESSYGKALEAARADQQPLLVVLDKPGAADARLAPELLSPPENGPDLELLRRYHLCHVDVTTEYGQKVAEAFRAQSFPFVAVIDKSGSVIIYSKAGKIDSNEWEQMLATYKSGDRSVAKTRVSYKPNGSIMFQNPANGSIMSGSCPNCQQRSF